MDERVEALKQALTKARLGNRRSTHVEDHSIYPETEPEIRMLLDRLAGLAGRVVGVQEWRSLFSACRRLLPRSERVAIEPFRLDLRRFSGRPQAQVLSTTLTAFASYQTYASNRRYHVQDWFSLIRDYYSLTAYLLPPRGLEFAHDFLQSARKADDDVFIRSASIIAGNEPLVLRQVVSSSDLGRWNESLTKRINEAVETGREYEGLVEEGELSQDDFDDWYSKAEDLVEVAKQFYTAFNYRWPDALANLSSLMESVERPPDSRSDDDDSFGRDSASHREIEYWTVTRMFEDL